MTVNVSTKWAYSHSRQFKRTGLHGRCAQHKVGWDGPVRSTVLSKLVTNRCNTNKRKTNRLDQLLYCDLYFEPS